MDAMHNPRLTAFCPQFHRAVELIGRRWTGAILRAMMSGARRFSDIANAVPGLSDRLLAERLRELELEGIVTRTVIPDMPVRVEYCLTEKGSSLEQVLASIGDWATVWIEAPAQECDEVTDASESGSPEVALLTR